MEEKLLSFLRFEEKLSVKMEKLTGKIVITEKMLKKNLEFTKMKKELFNLWQKSKNCWKQKKLFNL